MTKKLASVPKPPRAKLRAVIYSRISEDVSDEGKGVERQRQDCDEYVKTHDYEFIDFYEDNDISASPLAKKERPDYQRLLKDAYAGKFDVIVAYSNSRITRRPVELEDLIVLYEKTGVVIHTVVSGQDDLSTADGRMVARIKASIDAAEAERIGERVKRQKRQRAEEGKPQGSRYRTYGFERDWTIIKPELAAMAEAFKRRAKGESTTSIAKDFKKKGLKTSTGNEWTSGILMTNLGNPIYAGLRRYNGEVIGKISQDVIPHIEGVYPCVSEEVFELTQSEIVKDSKGQNARTHMGTGFLLCKLCLTGMKGNSYTKNYRCSTTYGGCGRVSIRMEQTNRTIVYMMMTRHLAKVAKEKRETKPEPRDFDGEIAEIDKAIAKLQAGYEADVYTLREVQPLLKTQRDLKKAVQKAQAMELPERNPHNMIQTYMDFYKMSNSQKRTVIAEYIDNIIVKARGQKGNHIFDYSRLEFHFKDGTIEVADGGDFTEDVEHE